MDKNLENHNLNEYDNVAKASMNGSKTKERSSKCSQCDFASNHTGSLRRHSDTSAHAQLLPPPLSHCRLNTEYGGHLKIHSGEKSNKCNQCDFVSSYASALRVHLKTHRGEKSNKCNQCDFASAEARDLIRHFIRHSGEKPNKCDQCNFASA